MHLMSIVQLEISLSDPNAAKQDLAERLAKKIRE